MTLKEENEMLRGLLEAALYYVPSNKTDLPSRTRRRFNEQWQVQYLPGEMK